MAYSRSKRTSTALYASSTAVVTMEVVKFICCMFMTHIDEAPKRSLWQTIEEELFNKPHEMMKLAVPSVLYSIQNNLLYYALSHLDAATFQVSLFCHLNEY
jgi:UDP-sugar transporter A1/2/3